MLRGPAPSCPVKRSMVAYSIMGYFTVNHSKCKNEAFQDSNVSKKYILEFSTVLRYFRMQITFIFSKKICTLLPAMTTKWPLLSQQRIKVLSKSWNAVIPW